MQLFIGQIHSPSSLDRDDFDYLVAKTSEAEVITTIWLECVQRIVDTGLETEEGTQLAESSAKCQFEKRHDHVVRQPLQLFLIQHSFGDRK